MSTQTCFRAAGPGTGVTSGSVTLPGTPESAGAARAFAAAALAGQRRELADDVATVVTELAANAVLHSRSGRPGGTFTLRLQAVPGEPVLIEVRDQGPAPAPARSGPDQDGLSESGRGLAMVAALSAAWGRDGHGLSWALVGQAA